MARAVSVRCRRILNRVLGLGSELRATTSQARFRVRSLRLFEFRCRVNTASARAKALWDAPARMPKPVTLSVKPLNSNRI
jgi:hypothetical protein